MRGIVAVRSSTPQLITTHLKFDPLHVGLQCIRAALLELLLDDGIVLSLPLPNHDPAGSLRAIIVKATLISQSLNNVADDGALSRDVFGSAKFFIPAQDIIDDGDVVRVVEFQISN